MRELKLKAIALALKGLWEEAVTINQLILEENDSDIATLNRLGLALTELGRKNEAKDVYNRVLELDKYNSIALKFLRCLPQKNGKITTHIATANEDFIEETGLTKTLSLIKVGSRENLANISSKQIVILVPRGRLISIVTTDKITLGCLPDDISRKLLTLIKKGYQYQACAKSIGNNSVTIFVREIKRPKSISYLPSFSKKITYGKIKK